MTGHSHGAYGASGPPAVQIIDARPVEATYRVVEERLSASPARRGRNGFIQFVLEFGQAVFGVVVSVVRAIVGLGMPIGVLACMGFLILYGFIGVQSCLHWAAGSGALAFASFTFCYLTGLVQGSVDRFVVRGRA